MNKFHKILIKKGILIPENASKNLFCSMMANFYVLKMFVGNFYWPLPTIIGSIFTTDAGLILGLSPANERWRCSVMTCVIG